MTTAQRWFSRSDKIGDVIFAPVTREISWAATDHVRAMLGRHHGFRPDEDAALGIFNVQEAMQIVELLGLGIRIFLTSASLITLLVAVNVAGVSPSPSRCCGRCGGIGRGCDPHRRPRSCNH